MISQYSVQNVLYQISCILLLRSYKYRALFHEKLTKPFFPHHLRKKVFSVYSIQIPYKLCNILYKKRNRDQIPNVQEFDEGNTIKNKTLKQRKPFFIDFA